MSMRWGLTKRMDEAFFHAYDIQETTETREFVRYLHVHASIAAERMLMLGFVVGFLVGTLGWGLTT